MVRQEPSKYKDRERPSISPGFMHLDIVVEDIVLLALVSIVDDVARIVDT